MEYNLLHKFSKTIKAEDKEFKIESLLEKFCFLDNFQSVILIDGFLFCKKENNKLNIIYFTKNSYPDIHDTYMINLNESFNIFKFHPDEEEDNRGVSISQSSFDVDIYFEKNEDINKSFNFINEIIFSKEENNY